MRARVAASPEQRLPRAVCVDISRGGLLVAFDEPVGFAVGHRLVASIDLPDGQFHALALVVRTDRGEDFRTYMAIEFLNLRQEEFDDLAAQLDHVDDTRRVAQSGSWTAADA
ncbi:MAG: hypothetical protein JWN39_836 [Ilumatobacteraceae bacterium]|nr:hypothetical protein [Ilumatobacteraceae bacterium]